MEVPRIWRLKDRMLSFEGEICPNGHPSLYPRGACYECIGDRQVKPQEKATVASTKVVLYEASNATS